MRDELFYIIYFSPLLSFLIIGIIAVLVGSLRIKLNFSVDKLKLIQNGCKKNMIIYFIAMFLLPITLIPIHHFFSRFILITQFFILFFTISFSLTFMAYLQKYLIIRKKLQKEDNNE